ncbi:MAG: ferritin-like domain-containing protein [Candidatus Helarchaeota archaeon]
MALKMPDEYINLLNQAIARELAVSIQYMIQHSKVEGLKKRLVPENILFDDTTFDVFAKILEEIAIQEMEHAEEIAERVYVLGGEATIKADKITIGNSINEMMSLGVKAEEEALILYRQVISEAMKNGDYTTYDLFIKIYKEEEEHLLKFKEYLE